MRIPGLQPVYHKEKRVQALRRFFDKIDRSCMTHSGLLGRNLVFCILLILSGFSPVPAFHTAVRPVIAALRPVTGVSDSPLHPGKLFDIAVFPDIRSSSVLPLMVHQDRIVCPGGQTVASHLGIVVGIISALGQQVLPLCVDE